MLQIGTWKFSVVHRSDESMADSRGGPRSAFPILIQKIRQVGFLPLSLVFVPFHLIEIFTVVGSISGLQPIPADYLGS